MSEEERNVARKEIHETLKLCNFCVRNIGLSFIDIPKSFFQSLTSYLSFIMSSSLLVLMLAGEIAYVAGQMINTASVEEFVGSYLHIAGYDTMSFGKLITIWYKRHTFRQLVVELAEIWPASIRDRDGVEIKRNSLSTLKHRQFLYAFWNILGVWLYNLTPIAVLLYRKLRGMPAALGYVWQMAYPFDKTKPAAHGIVYIFETCAGCISVCCMLGSDLLFMTMASHISMLLRLLQNQIRRLGTLGSKDPFDTRCNDCYKDIVEVVKIHQRLIRYIKDLEDAFSVVNLINVLLSSVNICCVMFTIVFLDSWMEMSNKFYLGAALTQIFIVCWYADDIYRASVGVADAVYESGWYKSNTRCRRAMLVVLQRSQRPLYFTALKFRAITMITYSSILTTAYSYFTLLYTSYRRD
ncbi:odorant receptor 4-like [Spodoptera frugiperda]|uniref:Odorant receptor n=1 Tax=Spodoptera frugiperda TaxID=7108 RepID=A0A9R0DU66_SPOFR|nr:odorant receptor 4-like [Spodoptera frugiperda]